MADFKNYEFLIKKKKKNPVRAIEVTFMKFLKICHQPGRAKEETFVSRDIELIIKYIYY